MFVDDDVVSFGQMFRCRASAVVDDVDVLRSKSHRRAGRRRDEAKIPRRRPPRSSKLLSKVLVRRDAKSDRRNPAKSRDPPIEVSLITARVFFA